MKKIVLFFILSFPLLRSDCLAQLSQPEFGYYSETEKNLKECPFDKDAEAVILLDEAFSNYDDEYHLITTRRVRIKILNQRGIDRGNIRIRFYSKNQFEFISQIEGMTYTENETSSISYLNKKSIYTEKEDDRISAVKFALPNVKVGSIIEYKYESEMKHYGGLQDWLFQSDIPTLKSRYKLTILPGAEFSYVVSKKSNYPVVITPDKEKGQIYFEMNDIPGLRFEPYMDAAKDYLQRVQFQLSAYTTAYGAQTKVYQTWKAISYELATDQELGSTLKKSLPVPADLKSQVDKQAVVADKIKIIYNYVKNNYTWNGLDSKFAGDGLKKIVDKRSGTSGEINLILLNLLQSFDIEAYPLLVAERDFGKVHPDIPLIDAFNKTAACVLADGKTFILDATQKYCPLGLTPSSLLNTYALVLNKKNDKLMTIGSNDATYNNKADLKLKLDENGHLSGMVTISSSYYAKEFFTGKIKDNEKKYISNYIEEPQQGLKVESFSYDNIDNDSDLVQHIKFNDQLNEDGGFVLLNYNLFTGLSKNPFTGDERFTDVNFGYPYHVSVEETIELPANSKTDDLPKGKMIRTPDKDISIARQITRTGNTLQVKIDFQQSVTSVPGDNYAGLKQFYKQMIEMLNEPVVIKMGK
jgi:hypothetical protein